MISNSLLTSKISCSTSKNKNKTKKKGGFAVNIDFLFDVLEFFLSFITPHLLKSIEAFKFYNWKRIENSYYFLNVFIYIFKESPQLQLVPPHSCYITKNETKKPNKQKTCKFYGTLLGETAPPTKFKGVLHLLPQKAPKLACFALYLKIINIFLKNNICILQ